ncbi:hypothetical protein GALMADRAFT_141084 [Galerina marginata CBS 339.88]|uniref:Uncharacterized protein n=1 Tax=Galerina marginata (strain CBS 339.88) TaxID=685588 RepID=A0A067T468_GALM3|nr:hypothetical protein GALMADRAFT_141084 [Galerina marginata CBS 339.88]
MFYACSRRPSHFQVGLFYSQPPKPQYPSTASNSANTLVHASTDTDTGFLLVSELTSMTPFVYGHAISTAFPRSTPFSTTSSQLVTPQNGIADVESSYSPPPTLPLVRPITRTQSSGLYNDFSTIARLIDRHCVPCESGPPLQKQPKVKA